jgi:hypothetical protein
LVLGFLLPLIPCAKEQAILLACAFGIMVLLVFGLERRRSAVAWTAAGAGLAVAALLSPYVVLGTGGDLLNELQIVADYRRLGLWGGRSGVVATAAGLAGMVLYDEVRLLTLGSLCALPWVVYGMVRWRDRLERLQLVVAAMAVVLFVFTLHAVADPGNYFTHYALLFVFPCSILPALALHLIVRDRVFSPWTGACLLALVLIFAIGGRREHAGVVDLRESCGEEPRNALTRDIQGITQPGDRMLVWGWQNSYFVETGLLQGARYMYPVFAMGDYSGKEKVVRMYLRDLELLKPRVIVEWVGRDHWYFGDRRTQGLGSIPAVGEYVAAHYEIVKTVGEQRLFVRKAEVGRGGWREPR